MRVYEREENSGRIYGKEEGERDGGGGIRERCEEYMTNDDERDGEVR